MGIIRRNYKPKKPKFDIINKISQEQTEANDLNTYLPNFENKAFPKLKLLDVKESFSVTSPQVYTKSFSGLRVKKIIIHTTASLTGISNLVTMRTGTNNFLSGVIFKKSDIPATTSNTYYTYEAYLEEDIEGFIAINVYTEFAGTKDITFSVYGY